MGNIFSVTRRPQPAASVSEPAADADPSALTTRRDPGPAAGQRPRRHAAAALSRPGSPIAPRTVEPAPPPALPTASVAGAAAPPAPETAARAPGLLDLPPEVRDVVGRNLGPRASKALRGTSTLLRREVDATVHTACCEAPHELPAVLDRFPSLEKLGVIQQWGTDAPAWTSPRLAKDHLRLQDLELRASFPRETVLDMAFLHHLPGLRRLRVDVTAAGGPAWLSKLAELPRLESFASQQWSDGSPVGTAIIGRMTNLKELELHCAGLHETGINDLANLKELDSMSLTGAGTLNGDGLQKLASMPKLRSVMLEGHWKIEHHALDDVTGLQSLETLNLKRFHAPIDGRFAALRRAPKLARISLVNCRIEEGGTESLAGMARLRHVRLEWCYGDISGAVAAIGERGQLESFALIGPGTPTDLETGVLSRCKGLKRAELGFNPAFNDASLANLLAVPRDALDTLSVAGCSAMTDAGIAQVRGLPNLTDFEADQTQAGAATLEACGSHAKLRSLSLQRCRHVSDDSLAHLARSRSLVNLSLGYNAQITDAGIAHLATIPTLRTLDLRWCKHVSTASVEALQRRLPDLEIAGIHR